MKDMKVRIREARREAGLTQQQLADVIGVKRGAVGNWESLRVEDVPTLHNLSAIARACRTTMARLVAGPGDNLSPLQGKLSLLPVLRWNQITESGLTTDVTDDIEKFSCPIPCSPESFILRVNTRAMTSDNPLEDSYPEGRLIYCDPDVPGELTTSRIPVVAWLPERGESVFRLLVSDGGQSWLQGLNRDFPRMAEPFVVRAIVIGLFSPTVLKR